MADDQTGARPSRRPTRDDVADWQARTFRRLDRYIPPPPGTIGLDDELADDPADDPDAAAAHIVALDDAGLLRPPAP